MTRFRLSAPLLCYWMFVALSDARAADVEKGKALFEKCAACHSLSPDKNVDAPTLSGIFGRRIASIEEFRYSAAMKRSDVVWVERTLDTFLEDPQVFIPGNRMSFDGLKDKSAREDLLAYLKLATKQEARYERSGTVTVIARRLGDQAPVVGFRRTRRRSRGDGASPSMEAAPRFRPSGQLAFLQLPESGRGVSGFRRSGVLAGTCRPFQSGSSDSIG